MTERGICSIALNIPPDRTLAEANRMLNTLFDGENMVSMRDASISPNGYDLIVDCYDDEFRYILGVIDRAGFRIDYDEMADWEVEP